MANQIAEHTRLGKHGGFITGCWTSPFISPCFLLTVEQAVVAINEVITEENPERFLESLQNTQYEVLSSWAQGTASAKERRGQNLYYIHKVFGGA